MKVSPLTGDYIEHSDTVTVASLADLKGFEFSLVIVVGCSDGIFPDPVPDLFANAVRVSQDHGQKN